MCRSGASGTQIQKEIMFKRSLNEMVEATVTVKIPSLDQTFDLECKVREGAYFEDVERAILSHILWNAKIGTDDNAIGMANH